MRLRNVPGARETIIENQFSIQQPEQMKGKWAEVFKNDHPTHIEVGMGKGQFIMIRMDAENIEEVFDKDEVDRIYLNFSDPWPKDRHAKRRLTSTRFLERYDNILTPEGRVMFKTDNKDLFDFSLEQVEEAGWILENHTYDLHHSEYNEGNVMTEYEEKFSAKGNPICRLVAYRHAK